MKPIQMVDLKTQFQEIKQDVLSGIEQVCENAQFINGPAVKEFSESLKQIYKSNFVIPCANGTDAIQVALMALGLKPGNEVIVPTWTFVATSEVIKLLQLNIRFVDVNPNTFNIDIEKLNSAITPQTKAIIAVHLYGQCCDMEPLLQIAREHNLFVIEDTAQAIGAQYTFSDGTKKYAGTMGDFGTTSFFPSKNLGGYGDGGAILVQDEKLALIVHAICNHGELTQKYHHDIVGVNSRLDTIQAVILNIKLKHLNRYEKSRLTLANSYTEALSKLPKVKTPSIAPYSTHVFHQYTICVPPEDRNPLKEYLMEYQIPSMIYYPIPLHKQKAYQSDYQGVPSLEVADGLVHTVLSLPMHSEMDEEQTQYIIQHIKQYFDGN